MIRGEVSDGMLLMEEESESAGEETKERRDLHQTASNPSLRVEECIFYSNSCIARPTVLDTTTSSRPDTELDLHKL